MHDLKYGILKGCVKSFAITGIICVLISISMLFIDFSDVALIYVSLVLLAFECYSAAYFSTQIKRTKGLLQGLMCGSLIFLLTMMISIVSRRFVFSQMIFTKLVVCVISGIFGGVKGINTKHTKVT